MPQITVTFQEAGNVAASLVLTEQQSQLLQYFADEMEQYGAQKDETGAFVPGSGSKMLVAKGHFDSLLAALADRYKERIMGEELATKQAALEAQIAELKAKLAISNIVVGD